MQPIMRATVASSERMRFFFGRVSLGARLRTSWKIAVAMVASAPMIAATMVSDRPITESESRPRFSSGIAAPVRDGDWITFRRGNPRGGRLAATSGENQRREFRRESHQRLEPIEVDLLVRHLPRALRRPQLLGQDFQHAVLGVVR